MHEELKRDGHIYEQELHDSHLALQKKEILDNLKLTKSGEPYFYPRSPLDGHEVTKDYRTKMTDWMVEVCTSFNCAKRSYYLAQQVFDKYCIATRLQGKVLENKDIHEVGVAAMYIASKYEDIQPLHSKVVSEKIAHKAISAK